MIPTIDVQTLELWKQSGKPHQLIDIREEEEIANCSIGGVHIPMAEIQERLHEIMKDVPVIIHCRSGRRADAVAYLLIQKHGYSNVFTLEGGILAWGEEIDPSLAC
jgi:rhodanese-related sulfurtransferase